jgi:peptidoglycan LD-endopeptidase LytH
MERDFEQDLRTERKEAENNLGNPWQTLTLTWLPLIKVWGVLFLACLSAASILIMGVAGIRFIAWTLTGDEKYRLRPAASRTASPTPGVTTVVAVSTPPQTPSVAPSSDPTPTHTGSLMIPVAGIKPEQLRDTYVDARSEGRSHNAIDIMAAKGSPVVAAADGRIARLFTSDKGGVTIYQLSQDEKTVYYYAHLDHYVEGVTEGKTLRQGETIAYVGDTGNAGAGNYHLHFAIWTITDPKRIWDGENINPYPLLRWGQ